MLSNSTPHQTRLPGSLVKVREELGLLVVVVLLDAVVPGDAVVDKVLLVRGAAGVLHARGLLIDAVEAPDKGVVA